MQRWEYLVLIARNETILSANGQQLGSVGFLGGTAGPPIHDYLNMCGTEGWEVVGMAPSTQRGEHGGTVNITIVLKRSRS
ncbi:MAG TPA: DUF4177 domain-containing protein [Herpetosiphonaceae bacterium]